MSVLASYLRGAQAGGYNVMERYAKGEAVGAGEAMDSVQEAFAAVESKGSGGYQAVGPDTGKGRAYGKYQVMDFNIGPWTEEIVGRRMTPEEFLNSPQAQDAVFNAKIGGYMQKYGTLEDAASMWFSGKPYAGNNRSDGYLTVPEYVSRVTSNYNPMQAYIK